MLYLTRCRLTLLVCFAVAIGHPTPAASAWDCAGSLSKLKRFSLGAAMLATAASAAAIWAFKPTVVEKMNQDGGKAYIADHIAIGNAVTTKHGEDPFNLAEFNAAAPQLASLARNTAGTRELTGVLRYWASQDPAFAAKLKSAPADLNEWVRALKKATESGMVSPLDAIEVAKFDSLLTRAYRGIAGQLDLSDSTTESGTVSILMVGIMASYRTFAREILDARVDPREVTVESSHNPSVFLVCLAQERISRGEALPDAFVTAFIKDTSSAVTSWPTRLDGESDQVYARRVILSLLPEAITAIPNPDARKMVNQMTVISALLEQTIGRETLTAVP